MEMAGIPTDSEMSTWKNTEDGRIHRYWDSTHNYLNTV